MSANKNVPQKYEINEYKPVPLILFSRYIPSLTHIKKNSAVKQDAASPPSITN